MSDVWSSSNAPPGTGSNDDLADLGSRLLAAMVDGVVGWLPLTPAIATMLAVQENGEFPDDPPPVFVLAAILGMLGVLGVAIWQWVGITSTGQTFGKRLTGIRIVMLDGSPVDFVRGVIVRMWAVNVVTGVANQCCLGWVVFLVDVLPIFGADRRCLHDHLAGTKVVVAP
jgi:uncharacterized RDD family membrane protein YckC